MDTDKLHMNTVSRRTRSRWDRFYRNCHNEAKRMAQGSEDTGRIENFECAESFVMRRAAPKLGVSGDSWVTENTGEGADEATHLKEVVVGSGSQMEPESGSDCVDCVVSSSANSVEDTRWISHEVKYSSGLGKGWPQIRRMNECSGRSVVIDLVDVQDSEDSGMNTDGSNESSSSVPESESRSENDSSDEDYKEAESSSSYDSEISDEEGLDGGRDKINVNLGKNDITSSIHRMRMKKESSTNGCYSSNKASFCQKKMESDAIIIDDEDKLQSVGKSRKMLGKRKRDVNESGKQPHSRDALPRTGLSMEEDDLVIASDLKRRRNNSLDVRLGQGSMINRLRSHCSISKVEKGEYFSPVDNRKEVLKRSHQATKFAKTAKGSIKLVRDSEMIKKIFSDSFNAFHGNLFRDEEGDAVQVNLPLKFRFEDEMQPPQERSEWEKEIDSLFCDLEMGLRECVIGCTKSSLTDNDDTISSECDESPAARCLRGEHQTILDEQIGIRCEYCETVLVEIKHVLPPFYTRPWGMRDRRGSGESQKVNIDEIQLEHLSCRTADSKIQTKGTVWDLMPGMENDLYPHQREGFEFIWRNVAGDVNLYNLDTNLSDSGRGCIISHSPGTGKTRLTIAFLLAFMKLHPNCLPVIVAPRGMLLTWEDEFVKWKVHTPFFNMNNEELSCSTNKTADRFLKLFVRNGGMGMGVEHTRRVKLESWMKSRGILGISYRLFEKLAGENQRGRKNEYVRKKLLEAPGILVMDEGHTARSSNSLVWKALTKVATQRRIMLTGTPFQNNFDELYNTLRLVNPKFLKNLENPGNQRSWFRRRGRKSDEAKSKWMCFTSSIGRDRDGTLHRLRSLIDPFVHVHKGSILQESLPGMRNTLIFLHPSDLQKSLLSTATSEPNIFSRIQMVSLVSVHPSLVAGLKRFGDQKTELDALKSNLDAGVKMKFIFNLISLAGAQGERVLIFSQFIDPLAFIKEQLKYQLSWTEGRQVLYMDGKSDVNHRQESISSFNDESSAAKVLLASQRACSEGISLVGASRVVLIDTVWNPSVERQAISRAFRLGQKRFVYVYRLMTSGTEFMQYTQQAEKKRISRLIFSAVDENALDVEMPCSVPEDKVLDAVMNLDNFRHSFAKIVHHPKESDLVEILNAVDV